MTVPIYVDEMLESLTLGSFLENAVFPYFSIKNAGNQQNYGVYCSAHYVLPGFDLEKN